MLPLLLAAAPAIGKFLSGAAGGASNERQSQNDFTSRNNQALSNLYGINQNAFLTALQGEEAGKLNRANLDLNQRQFALNAPSVRGKQGFSADLLEHFQPATMSGLPDRIASRMPTISGGPSLSGQGKLLAQLIRDNAVKGMQQGDTFTPVPETDFKSGILTPPTLQGYKQPGKLESILSTLGLIASGAGQFAPMAPAKTTPPYHNADFEDD